MRKTFIFYSDWIDYTIDMTLEEKGLFLQTILNYHNEKDLGDIESIKFIWSRVKKQIDENNLKWEEEIQKRSMAGKIGMQKRWGKKTKPITSDNTGYKNITPDNTAYHGITDNENVNDNTISKEIDIYSFWNSKKIIEHKVFTDDMEKQIKKQLSKYSVEDIKTAITNYSDILKDQECFFKFKWTLSEFLSRANGMPVFLDKRPEDYKTRSSKPKKMEEYQKPDARENFEFFTPEEEAKYGGVQTQ